MEQLVVWGNLDFEVANVHETLNGLDLPVAVFDCSAWGRITVTVCAWHAVDDGTFGHGGDLGPGIEYGIHHALLVGLLAKAVSGLADPLRQRCSLQRTYVRLRCGPCGLEDRLEQRRDIGAGPS